MHQSMKGPMHFDYMILSCQMQCSYQKDPAQSIIGNNSHKVVDCSDERTGSNCRVDVDLFEE